MANIKSAKKRAIQADKRYELRHAQRSMIRTSIKKVITAIDSGDQEAAKAAYQEAVPVIDRHADKEVIHKNKAARQKSRLSRRIKAMA